jgi:hypothetical protein
MISRSLTASMVAHLGRNVNEKRTNLNPLRIGVPLMEHPQLFHSGGPCRSLRSRSGRQGVIARQRHRTDAMQNVLSGWARPMKPEPIDRRRGQGAG